MYPSVAIVASGLDENPILVFKCRNVGWKFWENLRETKTWNYAIRHFKCCHFYLLRSNMRTRDSYVTTQEPHVSGLIVQTDLLKISVIDVSVSLSVSSPVKLLDSGVMRMIMSPLLLLLLPLAVLGQTAPTPVVLWHGMGDSAAGMIGIAVCRLRETVGLIVMTGSG